MAKCDFCGEKAGFGKVINREIFEFKACPDCFSKYREEYALPVIIAAFKGFYDDPDALKEWLYEKEAECQKIIDEHEKQKAETACGACPKCGGDMIERPQVAFVTDNSILPLANLSKWNTGSLVYVPHTCDSCGYTEFYAQSYDSNVKRAKEKLARIQELYPKTE